MKRDKKREKEFSFSSLPSSEIVDKNSNYPFFNSERWLSGLKRRIANPLYELFVPRVRIPLFPVALIA